LERLIEDPAVSARSALLFNDGTRTTIRARTIWTRSALAAIAASIGLLVSGVSTAAAAPAATAAPTSKCWLQVVNDWLDNNRVDGVYAIPCYTQAIQRLSKYPDVEGYSSAADDIRNALLAAIRQDRGGGGSSGTGGTGGGAPPSSSDSGSGSGGKSFFQRIADSLGPGNAQSVPLPLLVLAALALLLLLTAGGTWLARRLQARRVTPAPAPARRP
jgi:uncharacterized membrane protein YgcG